MKAVIFDLFGTLVNNPPSEEFYEFVREVGKAAGSNEETFMHAYQDLGMGAVLGQYESMAAVIQSVCISLGDDPSAGQITQAVDRCYRHKLELIVPRPRVLETLDELSGRGYELGLITDCTPDVPEIWSRTRLSTSFSVVLFSNVEKLTKRSPELFARASARLHLEPHEIIYVGDGNNQELTTADSVGMEPILIRDPSDPPSVVRWDEDDWAGRTTISSIPDVLNVLPN